MSPESFAPGPDDVDLIVYVESGFDMHSVTEELRSIGVIVERELPLSGVVGIRASKLRIGELELIPGVRFVREAHRFQVPPFGDNFPQ
jgi:hypothetical protein